MPRPPRARTSARAEARPAAATGRGGRSTTGSASLSRIEDEIREHYASGYERDRLTTSGPRLELLRTQELLQRFLPPPPADVLDVGGAAGVYAAWLAGLGYRVHLVEDEPLLVGASAHLLAIARRPA